MIPPSISFFLIAVINIFFIGNYRVKLDIDVSAPFAEDDADRNGILPGGH